MKSIVPCENNRTEQTENVKEISAVTPHENILQQSELNPLTNNTFDNEKSDIVIGSREGNINLTKNKLSTKMVCEKYNENSDLVKFSVERPKVNVCLENNRTKIGITNTNEKNTVSVQTSKSYKNCTDNLLNVENSHGEIHCDTYIKNKPVKVVNSENCVLTKAQSEYKILECRESEETNDKDIYIIGEKLLSETKANGSDIKPKMDLNLNVKEYSKNMNAVCNNLENSSRGSPLEDRFDNICEIVECNIIKERNKDSLKVSSMKDMVLGKKYQGSSDKDTGCMQNKSEVKTSSSDLVENSVLNTSTNMGNFEKSSNKESAKNTGCKSDYLEKQIKKGNKKKKILRESEKSQLEIEDLGSSSGHVPSILNNVEDNIEVTQPVSDDSVLSSMLSCTDESTSKNIQFKPQSCGKRSIVDSPRKNTVKKQKLEENCGNTIGTNCEKINENENDSNNSGGDVPDTTTVSSTSQEDLFMEESTTAVKRDSEDDYDVKKIKRDKPLEKTNKIETVSKGKASTTSTILSNLRGTLKSLTRSDMEELLVQKLCEVITEKSTVGELRRKAQNLELAQERWKEKVQILTKQIKEMEMVMKKYMSEVEKHTQDFKSQIAPLRVTRSVALQVSFPGSANKLTKLNSELCASSSSTQNIKNGNAKVASSNQPHHNALSHIMQKKPTSCIQKSPANQQKKLTPPRTDYNTLPQNRPIVPQPILSNNRTAPPQGQGITRPTCKSASPSHSFNAQQQQQQQQQPTITQKDSAKVIDLTEDDDRQIISKQTTQGNTVKSPGSIRVVNHLQQSQVPNNRFSYLLPTTSTATVTSTTGTQSRPVLVATSTVAQPNRLMCPMPPLLFKGGNAVQPSPQHHMLHQSNRPFLPKALKHPAPLPQAPANQINRPNLRLLPPRPGLRISKVQTGIVLSWNMSLGPEYAPISSYHIFAYQESSAPPCTSMWKKVGDVKALPLPMACTLTQFLCGHKYHFAVRAIDIHSRVGPFSSPGTIVLVK